jgi:hypothetical protein
VTQTGTAGTTGFDTGGFYVASYRGGSNFLDGALCEGVVASAAWSPTVIGQLYSYFKSTWGTP